VVDAAGAAVVLGATALDRAVGWVDVAAADVTRAELDGTGPGVLARAAELIGSSAGRDGEMALTLGIDVTESAVGLLAAPFMPRATTAQPATATDAAHADTTRPTNM
jgi:hypothetical protein